MQGVNGETAVLFLLSAQVVHDGETLIPVVGGFSSSPTDHNREYEQLFNLEGEYKFAMWVP